MPTFTYTKLINAQTGAEDLPRVDFVYTEPLPETVEQQLIARLEAAAPAFDAILISDQAETSQGGVVTPAMRDAIARLAVAFPDKIDLGGFPFARGTLPPHRGEAEPAGGGSCLAARARTRGLRGVAPPHAGTLPDCHSWRKRRAGGRRWRRTVGGGEGRHESGGHLRRGRQLQRGRGDGTGGDRRSDPGNAIRQPGGRHHHHETGHRHRLPRGGSGGPASIRATP